MATYNRPGVYVNELPLGAAPINGVSSATAAGAVLGAFPQGPDTVTLVTSWYDFVKKFGGYNKQYPATFSIASFFKNGGTELYVKRVLPTAAKKVAKADIPFTSDVVGSTTGTLCTIAAKHRGIDGNNIRVQIVDSKAVREAGYYDITVLLESGIADTITAGVVSASGGDDVIVEQFNGVVFHDSLSGDYAPSVLEYGSAYIRILEGTVTEYDSVGAEIVPAVDYEVSQNIDFIPSAAMIPLTGAPTPEVDLTYEDYTGDSVFDPQLTNNSLTGAITAVVGDGTKVSYLTTAAFSVGDAVTITGLAPSGYNGTNVTITDVITAGTATVTAVTGNGTKFTYTATNTFAVGDVVTVTGSDVSGYNVTNAVITDRSAGSFKVLGSITDSATFTSGAATTAAGFKTANTTTTSVDDGVGSAVRADTAEDTYVIDDLLNFKEFEVIDQPLVFFLPDVTVKLNGWGNSKWVINALIDWVDSPATNGRHFVVVDTAADVSPDIVLGNAGDLTESSRAAVYYPHFYIKDPVGRSGSAIRKVGPSGAVAGQYLATDRKIGPFKAPAGIDTKLYDAIALERAFSPAELDALNSGVTTSGIRNGKNVVNAIRNLPGAGIVIMGARTLKQDGTANRYINMRRSLTFIEKRLNDLAQFAVFENNTEKLWARLTTVLGSFLNDYRNQGGLRGTTLEQSFYIKCDDENNTPASIAAGEVHVEIGVALEYPAEFVVINLSQKTAE